MPDGGTPPRLSAGRARTLLLRDWPAAQLAPAGAITSLILVGRSCPPLTLSTSCESFSIGTDHCDLRLSRTIAPYVSARHARLERSLIGLRVVDQGSRNGLYSSTTAGRVQTLELRAGECFWLADVEILALDARLEALRPALAARIGLTDDLRVDRALAAVSQGGPLALVGPIGCGLEQLARQIHDASPRRASRFVVVHHASPPLDHAGTAYIDLDAIPRAAAPAANAAFAAMKYARVIVGTGARRRLELLARRLAPLQVVDMVPLASRPHDVVPLLDAHWTTELHSRRRVAELGDGVRFLAAHSWPGDLDELHQQSRRLLALLEHPSIRSAAHSLGIRRQTLSGHLERLGVRFRRGAD